MDVSLERAVAICLLAAHLTILNPFHYNSAVRPRPSLTAHPHSVTAATGHSDVGSDSIKNILTLESEFRLHGRSHVADCTSYC